MRALAKKDIELIRGGTGTYGGYNLTEAENYFLEALENMSIDQAAINADEDELLDLYSDENNALLSADGPAFLSAEIEIDTVLAAEIGSQTNYNENAVSANGWGQVVTMLGG